jgi:hypothetical protein
MIETLAADVTSAATMYDAPLTYFADGTAVVMRANGTARYGVASGRVGSGLPNVYAFQVVTWSDGTTDNVAPHVLHRDEPKGYTVTLDAERHPAYRLVIGRTVYTLPQCVCEVHEGECEEGKGKSHPDFDPKSVWRPKRWTRATVEQLAALVLSGKVPAPRSAFADKPRTARNHVGPRARKVDPTPEQVAALQALCDAA